MNYTVYTEFSTCGNSILLYTGVVNTEFPALLIITFFAKCDKVKTQIWNVFDLNLEAELRYALPSNIQPDFIQLVRDNDFQIIHWFLLLLKTLCYFVWPNCVLQQNPIFFNLCLNEVTYGDNRRYLYSGKFATLVASLKISFPTPFLSSNSGLWFGIGQNECYFDSACCRSGRTTSWSGTLRTMEVWTLFTSRQNISGCRTSCFITSGYDVIENNWLSFSISVSKSPDSGLAFPGTMKIFIPPPHTEIRNIKQRVSKIK